jgi:hypothetical protein
MATYLLLAGGITIAVLMALTSIVQSWYEEKRREAAARERQQ